MRITPSKIKKELMHFYRVGTLLVAMNCPQIIIKRTLYRMRGTRIGKNADISQMVFIDDSYPEYVEIGDHVDIGPYVKILTHDSAPKCVEPVRKTSIKPVKIGNHVYIGAGAIILPGVAIEDNSIIAAGSVVTKNVESRTVVAGVPAKKIMTVKEYLKKK